MEEVSGSDWVLETVIHVQFSRSGYGMSAHINMLVGVNVERLKIEN
jgi:hypothetical protein